MCTWSVGILFVASTVGSAEPPLGPEDVQATYRLSEAAGAPGAHAIPITFSIGSNMPLTGFSAAFTYDDAALEPESIECFVVRIDGNPPDFVIAGAGPLVPDPRGRRLGGCAFGAVMDLHMQVLYVPKLQEPAGIVRFWIEPDATEGSETALTFTDIVDDKIDPVVGTQAGSFSPGVNAVIPTEFGVPPTTEGGQVSISRLYNGKVKILGEVTFFMRGDANQDMRLDIADPIRIIDALFAGGRALLTCPDAGDANDDGEINVADPIALLEAIFGYRRSIPAPYPGMGADTSPDNLNPCFR